MIESTCECDLEYSVPAPANFSKFLDFRFYFCRGSGKTLARFKSAMGSDGVTVAKLRRILSRALVKLYTVWLRVGRASNHVLDFKTIFIPKGRNVESPAELRPI